VAVLSELTSDTSVSSHQKSFSTLKSTRPTSSPLYPTSSTQSSRHHPSTSAAVSTRTSSSPAVPLYTKTSAAACNATSATWSTSASKPPKQKPATPPNQAVWTCRSSATRGRDTVPGSVVLSWVKRPSSRATATPRQSTKKSVPALCGGLLCLVALVVLKSRMCAVRIKQSKCR
jgi:hypothetical protein